MSFAYDVSIRKPTIKKVSTVPKAQSMTDQAKCPHIMASGVNKGAVCGQKIMVDGGNGKCAKHKNCVSVMAKAMIVVVKPTATTTQAMDKFGQFIIESCDFNSDNYVGVTEVMKAFVYWLDNKYKITLTTNSSSFTRECRGQIDKLNSMLPKGTSPVAIVERSQQANSMYSRKTTVKGLIFKGSMTKVEIEQQLTIIKHKSKRDEKRAIQRRKCDEEMYVEDYNNRVRDFAITVMANSGMEPSEYKTYSHCYRSIAAISLGTRLYLSIQATTKLFNATKKAEDYALDAKNPCTDLMVIAAPSIDKQLVCYDTWTDKTIVTSRMSEGKMVVVKTTVKEQVTVTTTMSEYRQIDRSTRPMIQRPYTELELKELYDGQKEHDRACRKETAWYQRKPVNQLVLDWDSAYFGPLTQQEINEYKCAWDAWYAKLPKTAEYKAPKLEAPIDFTIPIELKPTNSAPRKLGPWEAPVNRKYYGAGRNDDKPQPCAWDAWCKRTEKLEASWPISS